MARLAGDFRTADQQAPGKSGRISRPPGKVALFNLVPPSTPKMEASTSKVCPGLSGGSRCRVGTAPQPIDQFYALPKNGSQKIAKTITEKEEEPTP